MSDWQERITHETAPAIRVEHELRYRLAAPLILSGGPWADLGCGNGVAAAAALGDARPGAAVLCDLEEQAVAHAAQELGIAGAVQLTGDLTDPSHLERISEATFAIGERPVFTCFEVVEHLQAFVPLIEWAGGLARERAATFLISVPNDAFWSIQNPHHLTAWGEGSFEELRRLLPAEQTLLRQVALSGSSFTSWDPATQRHDLAVDVGGSDAVATHFLAAFGPGHDELHSSALAVQTEMLAQRRWERQRESNLALMEMTLETTLDRHTVWFKEWRAYIHELERELGRPLSGATPEELPEGVEPTA
jgi:SAM-dependent methyltransferase